MKRKIGTGTINKDGYIETKLKGKFKMMHRLVWEQHNGPIPEGMHIHHINGDKQDNRIENLMMIDEHMHYKLHAGYKLINGEWWKKCNVCGKLKQLYVDFTIKDNKTNAYQCKECEREYHHKYYLKNREKAKEITKKHYWENRDECLEYNRQYNFNKKLKKGIVNTNLLHSYISNLNINMEENKSCQITA